jgi:hypothetical protein
LIFFRGVWGDGPIVSCAFLHSAVKTHILKHFIQHLFQLQLVERFSHLIGRPLQNCLACCIVVKVTKRIWC